MIESSSGTWLDRSDTEGSNTEGSNTQGRAIRSWDNWSNPWDANDDGRVSYADALSIINHLGRCGSIDVDDLPEDAPFLDVSADGKVTARDALVIINEIPRRAGKSEAIDQATAQLMDDEDDLLRWVDRRELDGTGGVL